MSHPAVAVSAPGKVLFAGGFLVLDRQHTGVVFGLDARIHVHVGIWTDVDVSRKTSTATDAGEALVLVQSPQFLDARWLYQISKAGDADGDRGAAIAVEQITTLSNASFTTSANKFAETALRYTLTYLSHLSRDVLSSSIKVTILADDDYYSRSTDTQDVKPATREAGFTSFGVKLSDAHKTGLGSSAALVTALVSALVAFYMSTANDATSQLDHRIIHNLAQAAHCAAQGKVGSGFDVAAAVYGSCLYRRFTPTILEAVGDATSPGFSERLHRCVDNLELERKWDVEVASHAVQIPDSLLLVMCDVDCGSETPGMVRKVLQWRKENPDEAGLLWNALQEGAEELCRELRRLVEVEGIVGSDDAFTPLRDDVQAIRSLVREMSAKSGVPIEPPVITELLDFCTSRTGVIGGVAPGAGGYDAVALLVRNDGKTVQELEKCLEGWKSREESGATIGHVRLLGVKQEKEGVRIEDVGKYEAWCR